VLFRSNSRTCLDAFEEGFTTLPFFDDFSSLTIDPNLWTGIDGVAVNISGLNEPSGVSSLNIQGQEQIRTARIDARFQDNLIVSYFYQRTGGSNSTETGDDLLLEFMNSNNQWIEIDRQLGSGPDMTTYENRMIALPDAAEHADLRVRFRSIANSAGFDDWFVDDVSIDSVEAVPGPFNLTLPNNNATNVSRGPSFVWSASENATFYTIEIDDEMTFSAPQTVSTTTPFTSFSLPGNALDEGTQYFWRVTASNINGDQFGTPNPSTFTTFGVVIQPCPGDCDDSGAVDFNDLVAMLFVFGQDTGDECDADDSSVVDFNDLVAALFVFGPCP